MPWLKTPFLLALSNGLAVLGVTVLIRAGQVSFGNAMFACLAGYGAAYAAAPLAPGRAAADRRSAPRWPPPPAP